MEDGGFTIVTAEDETNHGKKSKGSDGVNTVQGIKPEEAREYYLAQQKRRNKRSGDMEVEDEGMEYTSNKKKKDVLQNDFYKFQVKDYKKEKLEELRKGFEEDRRRLAKMMLKKQAKDGKAAKTRDE